MAGGIIFRVQKELGKNSMGKKIQWEKMGKFNGRARIELN